MSNNLLPGCTCHIFTPDTIYVIYSLQFVNQGLGFGDRQLISANYIGSSHQPSLNQLNYTLDLAPLASTNMSNILQPRCVIII